jgi:replicative DNA helicase
LTIDDKGAPAATYVRRITKTAQARGGLGLVIVDYLQLMSGAERAENRHRELSATVAALKGMARDLGVVVVLLSQINREPERRNEKRPTLADRRESGSIEEAADVVLLLYRDDYYNPDSDDKGLEEVNVAKNRNGPTRTEKLVWLGEFVLFLDHAWQADRL